VNISMDIHGKSVDMDMDGKFHIHGKPGKVGGSRNRGFVKGADQKMGGVKIGKKFC